MFLFLAVTSKYSRLPVHNGWKWSLIRENWNLWANYLRVFLKENCSHSFSKCIIKQISPYTVSLKIHAIKKKKGRYTRNCTKNYKSLFLTSTMTSLHACKVQGQTRPSVPVELHVYRRGSCCKHFHSLSSIYNKGVSPGKGTWAGTCSLTTEPACGFVRRKPWN